MLFFQDIEICSSPTKLQNTQIRVLKNYSGCSGQFERFFEDIILILKQQTIQYLHRSIPIYVIQMKSPLLNKKYIYILHSQYLTTIALNLQDLANSINVQKKHSSYITGINNSKKYITNKTRDNSLPSNLSVRNKISIPTP